MKNEPLKKFITPDLYEAAAVMVLTGDSPELFTNYGRIEFAWEDTPTIRLALDQYRQRVKLDAYLFSMVLKKLRGMMISAKNIEREKRRNDEKYNCAAQV